MVAITSIQPCMTRLRRTRHCTVGGADVAISKDHCQGTGHGHSDGPGVEGQRQAHCRAHAAKAPQECLPRQPPRWSAWSSHCLTESEGRFTTLRFNMGLLQGRSMLQTSGERGAAGRHQALRQMSLRRCEIRSDQSKPQCNRLTTSGFHIPASTARGHHAAKHSRTSSFAGRLQG